MDKLLRLIEETDDIIEFIAQCPAGKRGRPLNVSVATALEKKTPGSVCAKTASARRGAGRVGERTVFYRNKTYGDKLRERLENERTKKEREVSGAFEEPKKSREPKENGQKEEAQFPVLWKGIKGTSSKQVGFARKLVKDFRNGIKEVSSKYPQNGHFFTEAWKNLHRLGKTGDVLERRGLDASHLVLTLLSPSSIKAMAKVMGIDITKETPPNFARIMGRFFKDDEEYNIAKEKAKTQAAGKPKGKLPQEKIQGKKKVFKYFKRKKGYRKFFRRK